MPFTSSTSDSGLEHFTVRFKWDTYDVSAAIGQPGWCGMSVFECTATALLEQPIALASAHLLWAAACACRQLAAAAAASPAMFD